MSRGNVVATIAFWVPGDGSGSCPDLNHCGSRLRGGWEQVPLHQVRQQLYRQGPTAASRTGRCCRATPAQQAGRPFAAKLRLCRVWAGNAAAACTPRVAGVAGDARRSEIRVCWAAMRGVAPSWRTAHYLRALHPFPTCMALVPSCARVWYT